MNFCARLLCPPGPPSVSSRRQISRATLQSRAPHSGSAQISHVFQNRAASLRDGVSLSPCTRPSTSPQPFSRAHKGGDRVYGRDRGSLMGVLPPASASPSLFLFLVCLSHLCYCSEPRSFLPLSCTAPLTLICQSCPAILCHPRKKGRNASGWQVSRQLCHGGPPSIVEPPFGSYYFFFPPFFYFLLLLPEQ